MLQSQQPPQDHLICKPRGVLSERAPNPTIPRRVICYVESSWREVQRHLIADATKTAAIRWVTGPSAAADERPLAVAQSATRESRPTLTRWPKAPPPAILFKRVKRAEVSSTFMCPSRFHRNLGVSMNCNDMSISLKQALSHPLWLASGPAAQRCAKTAERTKSEIGPLHASLLRCHSSRAHET